MQKLLAVIGLIGILLFQSASSRRLDALSFTAPFYDVDSKGSRIINELWETSGVATVNNKFIRLTPDRQSKRGAIWSKKALGVKNFNCIFNFRISGAGENFFGDGLALWVVQEPKHRDGPLHGSIESFYGIGIIFDTFKNTENLASHRDVLVIINNKKKTYEEMTSSDSEIYGCNTKVRYHEKRDDFSVTNSSRVKIAMSQNELTIELDINNDGHWVDCVTVPNLGLSNAWINSAHVGMTASTGQLADNHDVISFEAFSTAKVMEDTEETRQIKIKNNDIISLIDATATPAVNVRRLAEAVRNVATRLDLLEHEREHKNLAVFDDLTKLYNKIDAKGDQLQGLSTHMEDLMLKHLVRGIDAKFIRIEDVFEVKIDDRMGGAEKRFLAEIDHKAQQLEDEHRYSWQIPFAVLFFLLVVFVVLLYTFYRKMFKSNLGV